jgi:hypothetical protein
MVVGLDDEKYENLNIIIFPDKEIGPYFQFDQQLMKIIINPPLQSELPDTFKLKKNY